MRRSQINVENYAEVYQYFGDREINQPFAFLSHVAMASLIRPQISYDSGARGAIKENLHRGNPLIIAPSHIHYIDQYVLGAAVTREKLLRQLIGNTNGWAKPSYFHGPLKKPFELIGVIPVFRQQDAAKLPAASLNESKSLATSAALSLVVSKLKQGKNFLIFPEGTRNKDNPMKVKNLKEGVGVAACRAAAAGIDVAILPVGLGYGEGEKINWHHPALHFGEPMEPPFASHEEVTSELQYKIQHCVNEAAG